ncbi:MAG: hypothetical protein ABIA04_01165 [Pseudomonadota bacterium]
MKLQKYPIYIFILLFFLFLFLLPKSYAETIIGKPFLDTNITLYDNIAFTLKEVKDGLLTKFSNGHKVVFRQDSEDSIVPLRFKANKARGWVAFPEGTEILRVEANGIWGSIGSSLHFLSIPTNQSYKNQDGENVKSRFSFMIVNSKMFPEIEDSGIVYVFSNDSKIFISNSGRGYTKIGNDALFSDESRESYEFTLFQDNKEDGIFRFDDLNIPIWLKDFLINWGKIINRFEFLFEDDESFGFDLSKEHKKNLSLEEQIILNSELRARNEFIEADEFHPELRIWLFRTYKWYSNLVNILFLEGRLPLEYKEGPFFLGIFPSKEQIIGLEKLIRYFDYVPEIQALAVNELFKCLHNNNRIMYYTHAIRSDDLKVVEFAKNSILRLASSYPTIDSFWLAFTSMLQDRKFRTENMGFIFKIFAEIKDPDLNNFVLNYIYDRLKNKNLNHPQIFFIVRNINNLFKLKPFLQSDFIDMLIRRHNTGELVEDISLFSLSFFIKYLYQDNRNSSNQDVFERALKELPLEKIDFMDNEVIIEKEIKRSEQKLNSCLSLF